MTLSPTGVNLSDGSFIYNQTDLKIGSLSLERFATGGPLHDDYIMPFGYHSGNNFDIYVKERETTSKYPPRRVYRGIVHIGNSAVATYDLVFAVSPTFISPNNDDAFSGILEQSGGVYIFTDQAGTVYTFDGASNGLQNIANIVYANGRKLTFTSNASNHTRLITSSDGYAIVLQYSGSFISGACGFDLAQTYVSSATTCTGATLKTSYAYTNNALTSSTDVLGATTTYTYTPYDAAASSATTSSESLVCVKPPGYSTCKVSNTYASSGTPGGGLRVSQQTLADGSVWNFGGGNPNVREPDYQEEDGTTSAWMTNPEGKSTAFTFTKSSPYAISDANGKTSQYRFSGGAQYDSGAPPTSQGKLLMQATLPEGNEYDATYSSANFNLPSSRTWKAKPGSGLANRSETFNYPSCASPNTRQNCAHPTAIIDAKGYQTDYVYTSYGSIQSEMQPAPSSGAARPLKLYTYVQKYAYIKNSGGALVPVATPIWMLATETICQTAAGSSTPSCDAAAPRLQTTYQYGADGTADNLLVRGVEAKDLVTGTKRLTCFKYDTLGRKISETSPRGTASISVCP